jgi:hypothetical protein
MYCGFIALSELCIAYQDNLRNHREVFPYSCRALSIVFITWLTRQALSRILQWMWGPILAKGQGQGLLVPLVARLVPLAARLLPLAAHPLPMVARSVLVPA